MRGDVNKDGLPSLMPLIYLSERMNRYPQNYAIDMESATEEAKLELLDPRLEAILQSVPVLRSAIAEFRFHQICTLEQVKAMSDEDLLPMLGGDKLAVHTLRDKIQQYERNRNPPPAQNRARATFKTTIKGAGATVNNVAGNMSITHNK